MERKTFQTEMEVTGRISVEPSDYEYRTTHLKSVSTEDMQKELTKLKDDQSKFFILAANWIRYRLKKKISSICITLPRSLL